MGYKRTSAILDPILLEDFVERSCTDIREGFMDNVIEVLNKMSKKTGLLCASYLTAHLAKNDPHLFQRFLTRLEENPL